MIKKIAAFLTALVLGASLTACSGGSESLETTTLVGTPQPGVSSEITYYHDGDMVKKQSLKNVIKFADLGNVDKDVIIQKVKEFGASYKDVRGIDHKIDINDTEIVETGMIDFEKLDVEKAKSIPGLLLNGDPKNGVSLKLSVEGLEGICFKKK